MQASKSVLVIPPVGMLSNDFQPAPALAGFCGEGTCFLRVMVADPNLLRALHYHMVEQAKDRLEYGDVRGEYCPPKVFGKLFTTVTATVDDCQLARLIESRDLDTILVRSDLPEIAKDIDIETLLRILSRLGARCYEAPLPKTSLLPIRCFFPRWLIERINVIPEVASGVNDIGNISALSTAVYRYGIKIPENRLECILRGLEKEGFRVEVAEPDFTTTATIAKVRYSNTIISANHASGIYEFEVTSLARRPDLAWAAALPRAVKTSRGFLPRYDFGAVIAVEKDRVRAKSFGGEAWYGERMWCLRREGPPFSCGMKPGKHYGIHPGILSAILYPLPIKEETDYDCVGYFYSAMEVTLL